MQNSAMRDVLSLFYALYDYLVNKVELTETEETVKSKIEQDMGIRCDDSLDEQILQLQTDLNQAVEEEERHQILDNVVELLK